MISLQNCCEFNFNYIRKFSEARLGGKEITAGKFFVTLLIKARSDKGLN